MATITLTEALKYINSIKKALFSDKHLSEFNDESKTRTFLVTTAMTKEKYDEFTSDTSLSEKAVLSYNIMMKALAIMENLKLEVSKKNIEVGIHDKMIIQSLYKTEAMLINSLVNKLKDSANSYLFSNCSFTYEEAIAQISEDKKTVACYKPGVSFKAIETYKRMAKSQEKEAIKFGNEIAALNHTTYIEITDEDLQFIEEFC